VAVVGDGAGSLVGTGSIATGAGSMTGARVGATTDARVGAGVGATTDAGVGAITDARVGAGGGGASPCATKSGTVGSRWTVVRPHAERDKTNARAVQWRISRLTRRDRCRSTI